MQVLATSRRHVCAATRVASACLWLLGACFFGARPVMAWTSAQIRGAQANVELIDGERASVALRLRLAIRGGWLSELELPGIPKDVEFDANKPPTLVSLESGDKHVPQLILRRDVWRLVFEHRRDAPWRGNYTLTLLYRQRLTVEDLPDQGAHRATWSMPAWRMGLEDVRVWIVGPNTLRSPREQASDAITVTSTSFGSRSALSHHRAQLPRDTVWPVSVVLPGLMLQRHTAATNTPKRNANTSPSGDARWIGAWVLLLLALLKAKATRALATVSAVQARPLIPIPSLGLRWVFAASLVGLEQSLGDSHTWLRAGLLSVVVALALDRTFVAPPTATLHWVAAPPARATPRWTRLRRGLALHTWLDGTTPCGALCYAATVTALLVCWRTQPTLGVTLAMHGALITPLWWTATRRHLPWSGERVATALERWCVKQREALVANEVAIQATEFCVDESGRARDARVPLELARALSGVRHLALSVATDARTLRANVVLLVLTDAQSAAERALDASQYAAKRRVGDRAAFILPQRHITHALGLLRATHSADTDGSISALDHAAA